MHSIAKQYFRSFGKVNKRFQERSSSVLHTGDIVMFAKSTVALAALALAGSISAASAYEDPAYRIGDRYPFLAQGYTPKKAVSVPVAYEDPAGLSARFLPPTIGTPAVRPLPRMAYEDPAFRIADRY